MDGEKSAEAIIVRCSFVPHWAKGQIQQSRKERPLSMSVKRRQGSGKQLDLFDEALKAPLRHGITGKGGTGAGMCEERQASTAKDRNRTLVHHVMEQVASSANLNQAYKRVKANGGAPGVDGMTVAALRPWIDENRERLIGSLLDGSYRPKPVRGVMIPKPGGGMRQLGIPTVVDRLVQQAIAQVLEPVLDPIFSVSSFGFRPGRGAHDALRQASQYVADGYEIVVDLDLETFFDRVNHDILMARLARHVGDKRLLGIVRRFLQAGMMADGVCIERHEGTPQGGPLSPLLANLLLDDLDKELERRGHRFCRYADDCNIYVRSKAAGERVMTSVKTFLEKRLRLKVNQEKSAVAPTWERQFLGHRLRADGSLFIGLKSIARAKERLRRIARRNRSVPLARVIAEVNSFTAGWVTYFRHIQSPSTLRDLDGWLRRKLRCVRLKQCKRTFAIATFLQGNGASAAGAWRVATSGKGWWRLAHSPAVKYAMDAEWFRKIGLVSLAQRYEALNPAGNRRIR